MLAKPISWAVLSQLHLLVNLFQTWRRGRGERSSPRDNPTLTCERASLRPMQAHLVPVGVVQVSLVPAQGMRLGICEIRTPAAASRSQIASSCFTSK